MEWLLQVKTNKIDYREKDRRLQEQPTNGIGGDDMMTEMIRGQAAIKRTKEITDKQVSSWVRRVESHRSLKAVIDTNKENSLK